MRMKDKNKAITTPTQVGGPIHKGRRIIFSAYVVDQFEYVNHFFFTFRISIIGYHIWAGALMENVVAQAQTK